MSFAPTDYLHWYLPRAFRNDGAVNLHASGVAQTEPADLTPPAVPMGEAVAALETALASWQGTSPGEIVFTSGATGGTLLSLLTLAPVGSEILAEQPIYEPLLRQAERLGPVRRLPRLPGEGFRLDPGRAAALIGDRTSLVMLTEPHNPSGVLSARDDVLEIARLAGARGAMVLVNEVYRGFTNAPTYLGAAPNIAVVSSLSKLLGAYWARIGWIAAAPATAALLREARFSISAPCHPAASWGLAFVGRAEGLRAEARRISAAGVPRVRRFFDETPGVSWTRPDGPGFACVELPAGIDDLAFAEALHDRDGVLVVPGRLFELPGTLRLSWLQAGDRLDAGLDLLAARLAGRG